MSESDGTHLVLPVSQRDHAQGPASAPVTLVEYGDYECPDCGVAYSIVKELQQRLGESLRFVYRNFPLSEVHPHAQHAAEAAEAAGAQGKFWVMHDYLYEHQRALSDKHLADYSAQLGLDRECFILDMEQGEYAQRVHEDLISGVNSGVEGTPTFFINGVVYEEDYDVETLLKAIEHAAR